MCEGRPGHELDLRDATARVHLHRAIAVDDAAPEVPTGGKVSGHREVVVSPTPCHDAKACELASEGDGTNRKSNAVAAIYRGERAVITPDELRERANVIRVAAMEDEDRLATAAHAPICHQEPEPVLRARSEPGESLEVRRPIALPPA